MKKKLTKDKLEKYLQRRPHLRTQKTKKTKTTIADTHLRSRSGDSPTLNIFSCERCGAESTGKRPFSPYQNQGNSNKFLCDLCFVYQKAYQAGFDAGKHTTR